MNFLRPSDGSRLRKLATRRSGVVTALDIGSSTISCLIARLKPNEAGEGMPGRSHTIRIVGIGQQRSRGIKAGAVVDLDAAEQAIRLAVDAAEKMAGVTIDSVIVNISGGRLASEGFSARINVGEGDEISEADIGRVLAAGRAHSVTAGRAVIHSLPIGYTLDANRGIRDPRGMVGHRLGVDMHVVTADAAPLDNLELCINRCHLSIAAMVATPYASGLSTLVDDEAELGVVAVDLGAATTTMGVFLGGQFIHADAIAIGGRHITTDIARGLSTSMEVAERLKIMQGSALVAASDERDLVSVPPLGDDGRDVPNQLPRSALTRIVRARVEETLELVRDRLNASGFASLVGRRIVLTGGASQLTGLAEAARRILARNVRLGRPLGVSGLPEIARGPAHAASVGMLIYPQVGQIEQAARHVEVQRATGTGGGYLSRMGRWFRESF